MRAKCVFSFFIPLACVLCGVTKATQDSVLKMGKPQALPRPNASGEISLTDRYAWNALKSKGARAAAEYQVAFAQAGKTVYAVLNIEFDGADSCNRFAVEGVTVFARFDRFADVFAPMDDGALNAIAKAQGVVCAELTSLISPPPPPKLKNAASRGTPELIVRGGIGGLTGKGVIIAVIDSGIDFRNPDFVTYDTDGKPTSRLLYLWDTVSDTYDSRMIGSKAPVRFPNGASVGTLYSREQLTAELRSTKPAILSPDPVGHGTSCAGIAAGNGNNAKERKFKYMGVAPDADLIGVRIGDSRESAYLLGAICTWIDEVIGARPVVISCSFGSHRGAHDGNLVIERQLDQRFAPATRGRALCVAAGNEGDEPVHAEATFKDVKQPGQLKWKAQEDAVISLYYDTDDIDDLMFAPAEGTKLGETAAAANCFTKQISMVMKLARGEGGLFLINKSGKTVKCDAYIHNGAFDASCVKYAKLVASPGTTDNAITVGSYDWNDQFELQGKTVTLGPGGVPLTIGALSSYSSSGPSRNANGTIKPDIVAPGQIFAVSYAKHSNGSGVDPKAMTDTTGNYQLFNGTSAATPYVAGVVALLMQKKPTLTVGEIKDALRRSATADKYTDQLPNPRWGYGKLDINAVRMMIDGIR